MTKDFKNPGLISQVAEFIDKKRIEEGISIDTLCQSAHISKRIYIDFKKGLKPATTLHWFFRLANALSQHTDEEKFKEIWLEIAKIMTNLEE